MVFFGDSCTQLGVPELVASYLRTRPGSPPDLDAVNLGVVGYSSYQGRILVERWTKPLEPDLAVIYFGWNDHWQAYGGTDSEKGARVLKPYVALSPLLAGSRVVQWVASHVSGGSPVPTGKMRVPIEEYRDNLVAMGQRLERAGSRVLFVTAPTSYATLGVPDWIIDHEFAVDKQQALELHRRYNQVVRTVAREHGWLLLDLEAIAERLPQPDKVFTKDGIHFTKRGVMWISRTIGDKILADVLQPGRAGAWAPPGGGSRTRRAPGARRTGG
jgi:lysophospholipase L1-like esterase